MGGSAQAGDARGPMCDRMPTLAPAVDLLTDPAMDAAERNWRANRRAVGRRQPAVAEHLDRCEPPTIWATARDGSVSARDGDGRWLAGCSVPRLAGRALLRTLPVEPGGHVLLAPAHAGLLTAARERLGPAVVLFVLQTDAAVVRAMLGAANFADDLTAGRLWLATGPAWADALRAAFDDHPGLTTPTRFVRTRLTPDEAVDALSAEAQRVFGDVVTARATALQQLHARPAAAHGGLLLIAGSRFRLWDHDASAAQRAIPAAVPFDADDPLSASPLALARAAEGCAAVLAVNAGRGNGGDAVRAEVPWVTWATVPAVPPFAAAGPRDRVVVADPTWTKVAKAAGWPAERVAVGRCPVRPVAAPPPRAAVAIIADTVPVEVPDAVRQFSSHQLLWEAIEAELHAHPWAAADPAAYLVARAAAAGIDVGSLDAGLFLTGLILPAHLQGAAKLLVNGGLPVQLWGRGWDALSALADDARGPVNDADHLATIVGQSSLLVRPTPGVGWHPVEAFGRPVLTVNAADVVARARRMMGGAATSLAPSGSTLADAVRKIGVRSI